MKSKEYRYVVSSVTAESLDTVFNLEKVFENKSDANDFVKECKRRNKKLAKASLGDIFGNGSEDYYKGFLEYVAKKLSVSYTLNNNGYPVIKDSKENDLFNETVHYPSKSYGYMKKYLKSCGFSEDIIEGTLIETYPYKHRDRNFNAVFYVSKIEYVSGSN